VKTNLAIIDEQVKPVDGAVHEFDDIGSILRQLRAGCEAQMTPDFNLPLSLTIDELVQQEEALCLLGEEGRP
jgi:hypothetical protein